MNKVKSSVMNFIALAVLAIFAANAAQKKRTPVYHSTLDSASAVTSPAVGPAGTCNNTASFAEGKSGNALYIPASTSPVKIPFENGLPQEKGCIEYWAKMQPANTWISTGAWPRFYCFNVTGTPNTPVSFLQLSEASGWSGGGFCCWQGNVTVESKRRGYVYSYQELYGEGESYLDWHHYEIVWNVNGLTDDAESIVAVKMDGNVVAKTALAGVDIELFKTNMGKPSELYFPLQDGFSTYSNVPYLIDEFKVWDSDVIEEDDPDPDSVLDDGVDVVDGVTWYYTLDAGGNATIVKGAILYAGDLVTPTTLDGHPVKAIGEYAFSACSKLKSVVVSDGVESVGKGAFANSAILSSVTMPDSVTFIDIDCFSNCTGLVQANLPPHITKVGVYTFHATALTSIAIPEGVDTIEHDAFLQCASLETVTLPATLKFIDWSGFQRATGLKRVEFPEGFQKFGAWSIPDQLHAAFGYCTSLEEAVFNGPLPVNFTYSWLDKLGCKIWYPKAYEESWAGAVPAEKFGGYTEDYGKPQDPTVDGVDVVDGVTWYYTLDAGGNATIVKGAISYAGELTTPKSLDGHPVKAIAGGAFIDCTGLISIVVQDGVEHIGNGAFARSPNLVRAILPDSATNIVESCFYECYGLTEYRLPQWMPEFSRFFFKGAPITSIAIPEGVTSIGHDAFLDCTKLETATLPSTLKFIDWSGFQHASALKRIEFPEGFEGFGVWTLKDETHAAFGNCTGLEEAVFNGPLPANFTYSWLDKLGCKIWYPKAYEESWAGAVPAANFGGYAEDLNQEIGFEPLARMGYDVGLDIEPVAVSYNGEAENVKLTLAGLPKGLAFKNGVISGAPENPGIYTVVAKAAAGRQTVAERTVEIRVKNYTDPLAAGLEDAYGPFIPGVAVDIALDAVKGWKTSGSLPAGLKFASATGRLAGVPTKPGVYTICFTKKAGIAVHAASATFTVAPLRRVVTEQEGDGTVKGAGSYLANAKAKISAKPAKGMAVEGWYAGGARISRDAAFTYIMGEEEEQTLTVKYVTVADDLASIACRVGGEAIGAGEAIAVTNYQGVAFSMPVEIDSLTNPKVTVSGLPKGLVYRDGMVSGAPTAASRSGKNGYTATKATFTVKTGAGNSAKYAVEFITLPRPAWSVGAFDGACYDGGALLGSATLTIAANGTVSGKLMRNGVTEAFTAAFIKAYDEEDGTLAVEVASKSGVLAESAMELLVTHDEDGLGVAAGEAGGLALELAQNAWKRADLAAPAFPSGKGALTCELASGLVLKFGAKGVVAFAGTKAGDGGRIASLSGKAQLLVRADEESGANARLVIYVAPKSGLAGGFCCEARLRIAVDEKNVATAVEEVID